MTQENFKKLIDELELEKKKTAELEDIIKQLKKDMVPGFIYVPNKRKKK